MKQKTYILHKLAKGKEKAWITGMAKGFLEHAWLFPETLFELMLTWQQQMIQFSPSPTLKAALSKVPTPNTAKDSDTFVDCYTISSLV